MKLEVGNQYVLTDGAILTVEKLLHTPLYGVNGKSVYICTISDAYGLFYYTKNGLHIFDYMPSIVSLKNKFEIGKRYVTRNGTEIILTAITNNTSHMLFGHHILDSTRVGHWNSDGAHICENSLNLISEIPHKTQSPVKGKNTMTIQELVKKLNETSDKYNELLNIVRMNHSGEIENTYKDALFSCESLPFLLGTFIAKARTLSINKLDSWDVKLEDGKIKIGCALFDIKELRKILSYFIDNGGYEHSYTLNGYVIYPTYNGILWNGHVLLWKDVEILLEALKELENPK